MARDFQKNPSESYLVPALLAGGAAVALFLASSSSSGGGGSSSASTVPVPVPPGPGQTQSCQPSKFALKLAEIAKGAVGKPVGDAGTVAKAVSNLIGQTAQALGVERPIPDVSDNDVLINTAKDAKYPNVNVSGAANWWAILRHFQGTLIVFCNSCPYSNSIWILTSPVVNGVVTAVVYDVPVDMPKDDQKKIVPELRTLDLVEYGPASESFSDGWPCAYAVVFSDG